MRVYLMLFFILFFIVSGRADVLIVDVPIPEYSISNETIIMKNGVYIHTPGAPKLPCMKLTVALPPGALFESVKFHGIRNELGEFTIPPMELALPISYKPNAVARIWESYEKIKNKYYSSDKLYPETYGTLLSKGGLRKYTLVNIVCYPFAYKPISRKLFYTSAITVEIQYRMPAPETEREKFWKGLMNDVTYDEIAKETMYNWKDAQRWYKTTNPSRANGYTIIIPSSLESSIDALVIYKQSQGYDVNVVTTEYIELNVTGDDLEQKIRNYLRENMTDIEYVLFVGDISQVPMRQMVPFNNDPDSPHNDPDISPIPSDLYYAELTDPDSLSWNSDGDNYYGEVFNQDLEPYGDDNPDYYADIHVGRIPISTSGTIEDICEKTIAFDCNTDLSYKTASLLAGGMIFFESENYSTYPRIDGADEMERLMEDSVIERANAVFLYEKAGLRASPYPCTDSLTHASMISYWNGKGIVYEYNHGGTGGYARKIWVWDDGDSIGENNEFQWPICLQSSDVYQLDNDFPATTFLRSCLCGKPEEYGLGAHLLHHGSSAVICGSRVVWVSLSDLGGVAYHFFYRLMKDITSSKGIVCNAYDLARNDFMDSTGLWINAYVFNLYGDPGLHQFGAILGIEDSQQITYSPSFSLYPNPSFGEVTIHLNFSKRRMIELDVYDISGRLVYHNGPVQWIKGRHVLQLKNLQNGIYFLKVELDGNHIGKEKLILFR